MAGQPKLRALRARIADAARAAGAVSSEAWLFARVADGVLLSTLCADLGCNRSLLYTWINKTEERRDAFRYARALAADSHADEAVTILDAADPATIGVARARAEYRRWLAQSFNREQYAANAPAARQTVSIQELHLRAVQMTDDELRRLVGEESPATPCLPAPRESTGLQELQTGTAGTASEASPGSANSAR